MTSKTIIAAEWMLLYCVNQSTDGGPGQQPGMQSVIVTSTYAPDTVKGADSSTAIIHTNPINIDQADRSGMKLYFDPDSLIDQGDLVRFRDR